MSKSSKSRRKLILPNNSMGDMETWADALDMINLKWVSNPVNESGDRVENEVRFNKIKQLLDCDEMESAHDFLYNITDPDGVSDEVAQKIDDLYDLAVGQGFIEDMASEHEVEEAEDDLDTSMDYDDENTETGEAGDEVTATPETDDSESPEDGVGTNHAWTCLYSAIKPNGTIVTGEFYSNAVDTDSARADCISQMIGKFGMKSVEVLAVEAQDMDQAGNTSAEAETPDWTNDEDWEDEEEVEEDNKASNATTITGPTNQVLLGEEGKPAEFKVEVTTLPSYGTGKSSGGTGGKASSCKVEGGAKKNSPKKTKSEDDSDDDKESKEKSEKVDDEMKKDKQTDEDQEQVEEATVMCMCPSCRKPGALRTDTHTGEGKCTKCGHWERGNKYLDPKLKIFDSKDEDKDEEDTSKKDDEKDTSKDDDKDKQSNKDYDDNGNGELDDKEKAAAVQDFVNLWKDVLKAMRIESYADMDLEERAEFWHRMDSGWSKDINPTEFIDKENQAKMENIRIAI